MTTKKITQSNQNSFDQKCAYHPIQTITNFCKCLECLLPVCPICIKLHSEQHKMNSTSPQFEQITKLIDQVGNMYSKILKAIKEVKQKLIDVEQERKDNEILIRKKLLDNRNRLIKEFQRSLIEMEESLIKKIVKQDQNFIFQLQEMDEQLNVLTKNIEKDKAILKTDECLKGLIIFFGKNQYEKYFQQMQTLRQDSQKLNQRTFCVTVEEIELQNMKKCMQRYLKMEILEWSDVEA